MSIYRKDQIPPHLADFFEPAESGLEPTPEEYVGRMVEVFRELRRVLRPDGTLWLNMGDSYASSPPGNKTVGVSAKSGLNGVNSESGVYRERLAAGHATKRDTSRLPGVKPKDLLGIPWMVAFALRADGWYLRQDIIWAKPNPMPESVRDRCTKAHEYVFLLAKSPAYFYDAEAVKESATNRETGNKRHKYSDAAAEAAARGDHRDRTKLGLATTQPTDRRNPRSVWVIPPKPYKGAHFAVMPPKLVERCVLAGTSARGVCPACGAPWTRQVSRRRVPTRPGADTKVTGVAMTDGNRDPLRHVTAVETTGWQPGCKCDAGPPVPAVVLDPFMGSGTVAEVAVRHSRKAIGCELNPDYLPLIEKRLAAVPPWETTDAPATAPPAEERPGDDG